MVDWHLLPGEVKIHETKLSWKLFWKLYLFSAALLFAGLFSLTMDAPYKLFLGFSLIILSLLLWQIARFKRGKERVLLTTERILIRKAGGLVHNAEAKALEMDQIRLSEIVNISVKQKSFLERKILNLGNLHIRTRDGEAYDILNIDDPYKLEKAIYHLLEKEKERGLIKPRSSFS